MYFAIFTSKIEELYNRCEICSYSSKIAISKRRVKNRDLYYRGRNRDGLEQFQIAMGWRCFKEKSG